MPVNERIGRAWQGAAPTAVAALIIVGAWAALASLMGNPTLLPSPMAVARTLGDLVRSGAIFVSSGTSLGRILLSWLLAALAAIPLGIAMGRSERMDRFVRPFVELFRPISPI